MDIFERVKKLNFPIGEYAVFGSSLLDVWGIRKSNDLDIIATPELFEHLRQDDTWKDDSGDGYELLTKGEADVTTIQNRSTRNYNPDRIKLIKEAVIINGVPFVRIEEVIACKKDYNRPKDWQDIASVERYMKEHEGQDLYNPSANF